MIRTANLKRLKAVASVPEGEEAFAEWLRLKDVLPFLTEDAAREHFIVYAAVPFVFAHAVVVPTSRIEPPDVDDLLSWNSTADSGWGTSVSFTTPPTVSMSPPLAHNGSKTLEYGEQLVFSRSFDGRTGDKTYLELLQKFAHVFELHFLPERNAYCRLDRLGDVEEVVRIWSGADTDGLGGTIVTFNRALLDEYATITDSTVVRTFDVTRFRPGSFAGWPHVAPKTTVDGDVFFRSLYAGLASYMRGCQIVRPHESREAILTRYVHGDRGERKYASFISHDFKNGVVGEISCAPGSTVNYFTDSDLPFEMSPAFFRPEVLSKYKADTDKYTLGDTSISCRGAWHLDEYDVNEAGQVHTYLVYLRRLPHEEQLYWKAHNEPPKSPISDRARRADFEGRWTFDYDPLISLRDALRDLHKEKVPWWKVRSDDLIDQVHYPVTDGADEWSSELLRLDQLLVEGFEERWLRRKVQDLGRQPEEDWRSLKLLEECLDALGSDGNKARELTAPLREVHRLRSKLKGHASGDEAIAIKRQVLAEHGSYKAHFRSLCAASDASMQAIAAAFQRRSPR